MILDSSAIVAILLRDPDCDRILEKIDTTTTLGVGAPTLVETAIVLTSLIGRDARPMLMEFIREAEIEVTPLGMDYFHSAVDAFRRFGKGRRPAQLNFGDCLAYAVAAVAGVPLVFKGNDFAKTDIPVE